MLQVYQVYLHLPIFTLVAFHLNQVETILQVGRTIGVDHDNASEPFDKYFFLYPSYSMGRYETITSLDSIDTMRRDWLYTGYQFTIYKWCL